jgi:hypothetical protein
MMRFLRIRPKLTLRATCGLIAIVALLIWGGIAASRIYRAAAYYRAQVAKHDMYFKHSRENQTAHEAEALRFQKEMDRVTKDHIRVPVNQLEYWLKYCQRLARFEGQLADYHLQLKRKYEYAASRPWIEVAPDPNSPPEPRPVPRPEPEHESAVTIHRLLHEADPR